MREPNEMNDDVAQADSGASDVGDVEAAGETTAAAAIKGPTDTRPVGADTMVKVEDSPDAAKSGRDKSE